MKKVILLLFSCVMMPVFAMDNQRGTKRAREQEIMATLKRLDVYDPLTEGVITVTLNGKPKVIIPLTRPSIPCGKKYKIHYGPSCKIYYPESPKPAPIPEDAADTIVDIIN